MCRASHHFAFPFLSVISTVLTIPLPVVKPERSLLLKKTRSDRMIGWTSYFYLLTLPIVQIEVSNFFAAFSKKKQVTSVVIYTLLNSANYELNISKSRACIFGPQRQSVLKFSILKNDILSTSCITFFICDGKTVFVLRSLIFNRFPITFYNSASAKCLFIG